MKKGKLVTGGKKTIFIDDEELIGRINMLMKIPKYSTSLNKLLVDAIDKGVDVIEEEYQRNFKSIQRYLDFIK